MPSRAEKPRSHAKRNPDDSARRRGPAHSPELGRPIDEMPLEFRERFHAVRKQGLCRAEPVIAGPSVVSVNRTFGNNCSSLSEANGFHVLRIARVENLLIVGYFFQFLMDFQPRNCYAQHRSRQIQSATVLP